jgi:hypothetical protein
MPGSHRSSRARVGGLLLLVTLAVVVLAGPVHVAADLRGGLLFLGPALLLGMLLLARRYPGEDVIGRWRDARRSPGVGRPGRRPRPRPALRSRPGGGRLIAVSLAGRAPPLAAGC